MSPLLGGLSASVLSFKCNRRAENKRRLRSQAKSGTPFPLPSKYAGALEIVFHPTGNLGARNAQPPLKINGTGRAGQVYCLQSPMCTELRTSQVHTIALIYSQPPGGPLFRGNLGLGEAWSCSGQDWPGSPLPPPPPNEAAERISVSPGQEHTLSTRRGAAADWLSAR